mgnify:FL=1
MNKRNSIYPERVRSIYPEEKEHIVPRNEILMLASVLVILTLVPTAFITIITLIISVVMVGFEAEINHMPITTSMFTIIAVL